METDRILTDSPVLMPATEKQAISRKNGITANASLINFTCGMIGPGCFSVAMTFKQAGLWAGMGLVFLMGALSTLAMHKIVDCSQYLAGRIGDQALDYGEMAEEAMKFTWKPFARYSTAAKWTVNGCLIAFQVGVLSVCFVFVAEHILEILDYALGPDHGFNVNQVIVLYFLPQLFVCLFASMTVITYLSFFGNAIIFAAAMLIARELFFHERYATYQLPVVTDFNGIALAAGGMIYAFEGQAMVLPLENKLKHPSDFVGLNGVLVTSMNLVMLVYAALGFFGYLTFGSEVAGSLTLNLPNNIISVVVKALLVAKIFIGLSLQLYVIVSMIVPLVAERIDPKTYAYRYRHTIVRVAAMTLSLSIALAVPSLYDIIPFVGITAGMLLSLILPSFFHFLIFIPAQIREKQYLKAFLTFSLDCLLFVLGLVFMISGLRSNIVAIVSKM